MKKITSTMVILAILVATARAAQTTGTAQPALQKKEAAVSSRAGDTAAVERAIAEIADAKYEVQARELARRMAELAVAQADIGKARIEQRIADAKQQGNDRELGYLNLDLKEVTVLLQTRKLQVELAQVEVERAKSRLALLEKTRANSLHSLKGVRIERIDGSVLVLRGAREHVEAITELLHKLEKKKGR